MRIYLTILLFLVIITGYCQQTKIQFGTPAISGNFVTVPIIITENIDLIGYFNFIGYYDNTIYTYHSYIASSVLLSSNSNIFATVMIGEFNIIWISPDNPIVLHDTIMKLKFINTSGDCGDFVFDTVTPNHQSYISNLENLPVIFTNYFCIPTNIRETPNDVKPEIYSFEHYLKIQNTNFKSLEIIDFLGRPVLKSSLTLGLNQFYINKKGMFLVRLTGINNNKIFHKFEIY